jgi:hypothetical protein
MWSMWGIISPAEDVAEIGCLGLPRPRENVWDPWSPLTTGRLIGVALRCGIEVDWRGGQHFLIVSSLL